jgi:hypothetical protein
MIRVPKSWVFVAVFVFVGCGGGGQEISEQQSFIGTISEVNAAERTISVTVPDTSETMEAGPVRLAFTDTTEVLKNFMAMPIDSLRAEQDVRVEAVREGARHVPSRVVVLGN